MTAKLTTVNRSATDLLAGLVEDELARQGLNGEQAAREARLPADAFRGLLLRRQRPSIDRADELCRALGITMTIGGRPDAATDNAATETRATRAQDRDQAPASGRKEPSPTRTGR